MAANNDYLDDAVQRLLAMWKALLAEIALPVGDWQVTDYIDTGKSIPLIWLYPGIPQLTNLSFETDAQRYAVNARVIVGSVEAGYDGSYARMLWKLIPAATNYFQAHKRLVYLDADEGQHPPLHLSGKGAAFGQIQPFGVFDGSSDTGIEFQHVIPFLVRQEPFRG